MANPVVTIEMENGDIMKAELYPEIAPNTVFIDIGVTKDFLKREWNHAMNAEVTPNCRMKCSGCGVAKWKGGVCIESKN